MDIGYLFTLLAGLHPAVQVSLAALGGLVVLGQAIVILTPSKADDEAVSKIEAMPIVGPVVKALAAFAPIQKK
jgi:hypothetical protein